jgi:3-(3-hydroxy-phenyl)propionate hydroxylase
MAENAATFDVAIIGCGPVGAMAANLLGRTGLRVLVVEQEREPYPLPRAVHLDHEIMRLLQDVDLAPRLLPLFREAQGHIHIGADGGVIRYLGTAGLHRRFGWANDYFFFQPELERELRAGLARFPRVAVRFGIWFEALTQEGDHVALTLRSAADDAKEEVSARYVIACDGASSAVRKFLDIPLLDLQFDEPWLVVDAAVDGPIRFPSFSGVPEGADLQRLSVMLCDPKRPATVVPGRGNHRRWEFMLLPGETEAAMMRPEVVEHLLKPWLADASFHLVRAATYRFHGLIAECWQAGSVFLAGDAAHQTPPFFGQGMCHGMRDVANLAWKIGLVERGQAPAEMLQSYQAERDPHVRAVVSAAINAGRYICELDAAAAVRRDAELRRSLGDLAPKSAGDLIPPIVGGITAGQGERFIQPMVRFDGRDMLLDEATGGGFVLLSAAPEALEGWPSQLRNTWDEVGGRCFAISEKDVGPAAFIEDAEGAIGDWLAARNAVAVLLRPDFYVFGLAESPADATMLVTALLHKIGYSRPLRAEYDA